MTENNTKNVGVLLELIGKALQAENMPDYEIDVVFDSIKQAPEQFDELYNDCVAQSPGGLLSDVPTKILDIIKNMPNYDKISAIEHYKRSKV